MIEDNFRIKGKCFIRMDLKIFLRLCDDSFLTSRRNEFVWNWTKN